MCGWLLRTRDDVSCFGEFFAGSLLVIGASAGLREYDDRWRTESVRG